MNFKIFLSFLGTSDNKRSQRGAGPLLFSSEERLPGCPPPSPLYPKLSSGASPLLQNLDKVLKHQCCFETATGKLHSFSPILYLVPGARLIILVCAQKFLFPQQPIGLIKLELFDQNAPQFFHNTLHFKIKKLSTNFPRDFNSVLDTMNHY